MIFMVDEEEFAFSASSFALRGGGLLSPQISEQVA